MSVSVEKLDKGMAKLTVELPAEDFEKAIEKAYQSVKGRISVPGFRKGKAPRKMVEQVYGKGIFYEDAANDLVSEKYPDVVEESGEDIVSSPKIDVVQAESGKPFIFTAEVALKPEVKLGKYKGVEAPKMELEVTDEEVDKRIEDVRRENSRIVDAGDRKEVKDGDILTLDYEGFVDGVPFEGGKGVGQRLTIGSGQFIPGFEEALIGAELEKETDVKVTFPEDYHAEELAGKDATFKCTVHKINERLLPELNDEYVSDISEFETFAEYKKDVREKLEKERLNTEKGKREDLVLRAVIDDSEMELPEPMIETQQRQILNEFAQRLAMQGMDFDQYRKMTGNDDAKLMEQVRPQALDRIRSRLVLEAVAAAEKLDATDEEVEKELKDMAETYKMDVDKLKENMGESELKGLRKDIAVRKAADFLVDNVKESKKK